MTVTDASPAPRFRLHHVEKAWAVSVTVGSVVEAQAMVTHHSGLAAMWRVERSDDNGKTWVRRD